MVALNISAEAREASELRRGLIKRRKPVKRAAPVKKTAHPAPAVYRYICPDGRSYVGSVADHRKRSRYPIKRKNERLAEAFKTHPPQTWTFELLEELPPGCLVHELRCVEQSHIDRLRSLMPEHGFNIVPAIGKTSS